MDDEAPPRLVLEADGSLRHILLAFRRLLIEEERVVRVLIRSFIAEGRRFAETQEGREWLEALSRSESVARGRSLWDLHASERRDRDPDPALDMTPSRWLSALLDALKSPEMEREIRAR